MNSLPNATSSPVIRLIVIALSKAVRGFAGGSTAVRTRSARTVEPELEPRSLWWLWRANTRDRACRGAVAGGLVVEILPFWILGCLFAELVDARAL